MGGPAARLNAGDDRLSTDVQAGDEGAFEALYDRHAAELHSYCLHLLGSGHDPEEVLQQTFWKAHRRVREGRNPVAVRPWLFTIARNECLTMLRRVRAERRRSEPSALAVGAPAPELERREGRDVTCAEIRAELTSQSGGSLRRRELREHLLNCPGCREFRSELRAAVPRRRVPLAAR